MLLLFLLYWSLCISKRVLITLPIQIAILLVFITWIIILVTISLLSYILTLVLSAFGAFLNFNLWIHIWSVYIRLATTNFIDIIIASKRLNWLNMSFLILEMINWSLMSLTNYWLTIHNSWFKLHCRCWLSLLTITVELDFSNDRLICAKISFIIFIVV